MNIHRKKLIVQRNEIDYYTTKSFSASISIFRGHIYKIQYSVTSCYFNCNYFVEVLTVGELCF